jgi:hypothetical protein
MLTSMYVHNHGCESNDTMVPFNEQGLDQDTVGTRMTAAGYTCGYFGKYMNGYLPTTYVAPGWRRWVATISNFHREVNVGGTVRTVDLVRRVRAHQPAHGHDVSDELRPVPGP